MTNSYLITGVAGFIGSELSRRLLALGHKVIGVDDFSYGYEDNLQGLIGNPKFEFVEGSILDVSFSNLLPKVDYVLHFAGISSLPECEANPELAINVNVAGTARILQACRLIGIKRLFFASTSALYENSEQTPFCENETLNPDLVYSVTKLAAEKVCQAYIRNYGLDVVIGRFFNVYGPHQDYKRANPPFTSYLIREVMRDRQPVLYNSSDSKRDYIYVDDLAKDLFGLIHKPFLKYDIYNLTSGASYTPRQILATLSKVLDREIFADFGSPREFWSKYPDLFGGDRPLSEDRLKKEILKQSVGSNARVVEELGYRSYISLESGLSEIIKFQKPVF